MVNSITWTDNYIIGIDEIDQQHKYLFSLINKMIQCSDEKSKFQLYLKHLNEYTIWHFNAEENLMKSIGYDNYQQHQKSHLSLIKKLRKKSKAALKNPMKREKLNDFLVRWLLLHVLGEDIQISTFLQKNFPPQKPTNQWSYSLSPIIKL